MSVFLSSILIAENFDYWILISAKYCCAQTMLCIFLINIMDGINVQDTENHYLKSEYLQSTIGYFTSLDKDSYVPYRYL